MPNASVQIRFMILVILHTAGSARSDEPQTRFHVTTRKADDRVTTELPGDQVIFTVTSASGIGSAAITRKGEVWPRSIILRLRLTGLERLRIGNGKATLSASVASSGNHKTILSLSAGRKDEFPIERSSPYWTEIRILDDQAHPAKEIPLKEGMFELSLPQALFASNPPTITLDWIDFYR
jgi:hypothetical protein